VLARATLLTRPFFSGVSAAPCTFITLALSRGVTEVDPDALTKLSLGGTGASLTGGPSSETAGAAFTFDLASEFSKLAAFESARFVDGLRRNPNPPLGGGWWRVPREEGEPWG